MTTKRAMATERRELTSLLLAGLLAMTISGCGGSGGSGNGGGNNGGNNGGGGTNSGNVPPVVDAGPDQNVDEQTSVQLSGSATDANTQDTLTLTWSQTTGPTVALSDSTVAAPTFTAPDVAPGVTTQLVFELSVSDGTTSRADSVSVFVSEPATSGVVTGKVQYEFVPPNNSCRGLNFAGTEVRPVRGATVQLINDSDNTVLATTTSADNGDYSFANIAEGTDVRLRVRAELKKTSGASRWDVEIRDNVDTSPSPTPLASRPLYVIEGATFTTGAGQTSQDFTARTGWGGSSYTGPRAAAPLAVLDAIYSAIQFIVEVDPDAVFPPLDAFWSVNNALSSNSFDIDAGQLGASFYRGDIDSLFLLGDVNTDTEEFDDHVIVHEWGHYFEDTFSRSDSIGGPHAIGQLIDPRLAFGEGWATALAGMALDNPLYCDTSIPGSQGGFGIGAESGSYDARGWYDEISVTRFIYDLWDTDDEGGDAGSIGFAPIYDIMTGAQAETEAFTTIFSFATLLRDSLASSGDQALLDSQLVREDMTPGFNVWGEGELNTAGGAPDVTPIYTDIVADGSVTNVCSNAQFDSGRTGNKLSQDRFLRVAVPATDQYDVVVQTTTPTPATPDPNDRDQSDPDFYLFRGAQFIARGTSGDANIESFRTPTLTASQTYIATVEDWRFDDDEAPASYPSRVCMDVSITRAP